MKPSIAAVVLGAAAMSAAAAAPPASTAPLAPARPASSAQADISTHRQARQDKRLACNHAAGPRKRGERKAFVKECLAKPD